MTNTLAYYGTEVITVVKCSRTQIKEILLSLFLWPHLPFLRRKKSFWKKSVAPVTKLFTTVINAVMHLTLPLCNCEIDIFIFRHCFWISRPKLVKFERDQNATEKFWIYRNESKNLWKFTKVNKFIIYYRKILLTFIKIHKRLGKYKTRAKVCHPSTIFVQGVSLATAPHGY